MTPAAGDRSDEVFSRLRQARIERGISRRDLASALGIHYQTVGYLERGEYSPSLALALRAAEMFDLPVEALFSLRPFPQVGDQGH
ncbi:helix-turn-helix transcriptional regulator [Demequina litorisediminis]|uniref:helix-turn-helix transcriptional regulator n=1 Tax=Demequina litorisediminis TaxID=1849022 RepID=UPI0024E0FC50|nr:helix-turn-helix transcriptional regulator [Demequina litorisediminis]